MSSFFTVSLMMESGISLTWATVARKSTARFTDDVAVLLLKKFKGNTECAATGARVSLWILNFPISFRAPPASSCCMAPLSGIAFAWSRSRP